MKRMEADVVVIGSGPGGATTARDLSRLGKKVVILERGGDHQFIGNFLGTALMAERLGFCWSEEGLNMIRALTTGGSSMIYCGAAIPPPSWLETKYGIDLKKYQDESQKEIGIKPLSDRLIGPGAQMVMDAALDLGIPWEPMSKFIDQDKCDGTCPVCMYGCKKGAKWSGRLYAYEAVENGATLINHARVEKVICENGKAAGVLAKTREGKLEVRSKAVVVSAGGLGTPVILKKSGIEEAGDGLFADPLLIVYGIHEGDSWQMRREIPMCCGKLDNEDDGIIVGDLIDPLPSFMLQMFYKGLSFLPKSVSHSKMLGVMIKIRDDMEGRVKENETFSKPLTPADRLKISKGERIAEKILIKTGCKKDSIVASPVRAAHPGGTAGIGRIVDSDLETRIKNLYVCDASVIPEPCGLPPVWTLVCFAKRLVDQRLRHLV